MTDDCEYWKKQAAHWESQFYLAIKGAGELTVELEMLRAASQTPDELLYLMRWKNASMMVMTGEQIVEVAKDAADGDDDGR